MATNDSHNTSIVEKSTSATKKIKNKQTPLIGAQAKPVTLSDITKSDIDNSSQLIDILLDAGLTGNLDYGSIEKFTSISNARDQIYTVIDTMAKDSDVASVIKTFARDACETADNGHIVWCESADPSISKYVNYLLDITNVDKNISTWAYNLIKYGDLYLKLYRESEYTDPFFEKSRIDQVYSARNILTESTKQSMQSLTEAVSVSLHPASDPYSYYVEMVADPGTMFELTDKGHTVGFVETPNTEGGLDYLNNYLNGSLVSGTAGNINYKMKSNDVNLYQADDYVHACLMGDLSRYPETVQLYTEDSSDYTTELKGVKKTVTTHSYTVRRGKSMLYDSYKVWREKALTEASLLLSRVSRSTVYRIINTEVGDLGKVQVSQVLRRVKELFDQNDAIKNGENATEFNNTPPIINNIYTATHAGQGAITVSTVGGDINIKDLADYDALVNRYYSSFGIPKAYFGYTADGAGFNGGQSLALISSQYAKGVKEIQNTLIQALTDMINAFLYNRGLKTYWNNFTLKMKAPLTQEEKDYRDSLSNRINAISQLQALFGDIEDKTRKLQILKLLVTTLNYGDELGAVIQEELEATKKAQKEEKAQQEAEAAAEGNEPSAEMPTKKETKADKAKDSAFSDLNGDLNLGTPGELNLNFESLDPTTTETMPLMEAENKEKTPESNFGLEDLLPTPAELASKVDFTKNKK